MRSHAPFSRRRFIHCAAAAALGSVDAMARPVARPAISRAAERPLITHGVQCGDVSVNSAVIWARADRPARMIVELAATEAFRHVRHRVEVDALPETDFTAKTLIETLPASQEIFYRVCFQNLQSPGSFGEQSIGRFRSAPCQCRSVSFIWSGDIAGQGWGIDEARGGMRGFAAILQNRPDFFVHCGDSIYADNPIPREVPLANGEIWRNLVTEEKSKVAETLAEFRGNYKYNLMDRNVQACNAEVPIVALWDDHEVADDWYPGQIIDAGEHREQSALLLAARAGRAFREFMPMCESPAEGGRVYRRLSYGPLLDLFLLDMRSYRGPNDMRRDAREGLGTRLLGAAQVAWLKKQLMKSRATWKVIAAGLPIGLVSADAIAQGDGPPLGREIEIAEILAFIKHAGVHNVVWISADMHYTAAHFYDPNRAVFQNFEPFWEFVSGPLHAGTWGPSPLDNTFGPRVMFQKASTAEQGENLPPCFGMQFFGHATIDGASEVLTVTLKDVDNRRLWSVAIEPKLEPWAGRL
jgi:alkaline phosphatase D